VAPALGAPELGEGAHPLLGINVVGEEELQEVGQQLVELLGLAGLGASGQLPADAADQQWLEEGRMSGGPLRGPGSLAQLGSEARFPDPLGFEQLITSQIGLEAEQASKVGLGGEERQGGGKRRAQLLGEVGRRLTAGADRLIEALGAAVVIQRRGGDPRRFLDQLTLGLGGRRFGCGVDHCVAVI
jgi:hypothetical protein